jgi:glycosyltransferase involved in cell wall biosynthesis
MVTVSDYAAIHLKYIFNVRIDAVIRNPLANIFLEPFAGEQPERQYVTFVGRLVEVKRLDLLLPPICDLLRENPNLHCCIVGDGPYRKAWEDSVAGIPRVEFVGSRDPVFIREQLRRSKIFISGAGNESLGIAYLEALTQGCVAAMPATGGGIEISLQSVGEGIQLLPISLDRQEVLSVLRRSLKIQPPSISLESYSPRSVASAYLDVDRSFFEQAATALEPVPVNDDSHAARIL